MLEDSNGDLIPQYFNQQSDVYEHLQGAQGVNFVGNHVLTDSGIWVPQRGTEDGAAHTQLTGSIEVLKTVSLSETIAPGERFYILGASNELEVVSEFRSLRIAFRVDNAVELPSLIVSYGITNVAWQSVSYEFKDENASDIGRLTKEIPVYTKYISLSIKNNANISRLLTSYSILGVR